MHEVSFSFFGHKPNDLGGYDEENPLNQWVKFSLKVLIGHFCSRNEKVRFLCGGHPGSELWAAEEILAYKHRHPDKDIHVQLILPFPNLSGRKEDGESLISKPWPEESHKRLMRVQESVDEVKVLSDGPYSAWRIRLRDEWVVENSLGAVVVKKDDIDSGPLFNVVRFSEINKVPVCIVDPTTERIYSLQ